MIILSLFSLSLLTPSYAEELWKGPHRINEVMASAKLGLAIIGENVGLGIYASGAFLVAPKGYFEDITNQAYFEIDLGPSILEEGNAFNINAQLRWDFIHNASWTFFALGGLGGYGSGAGLGDRWMIYPRFGIGAFMHFNESASLRLETSHDFTGLGISYWF